MEDKDPTNLLVASILKNDGFEVLSADNGAGDLARTRDFVDLASAARAHGHDQ